MDKTFFFLSKTILEESLSLFSVLLSPDFQASNHLLKKKFAGCLKKNINAVGEYITYHFSCLIIQKSIVVSCVFASEAICFFRLPSSKADCALTHPCSRPLLFSGCISSSFYISFSLLCIMPFYHLALAAFPKYMWGGGKGAGMWCTRTCVSGSCSNWAI